MKMILWLDGNLDYKGSSVLIVNNKNMFNPGIEEVDFVTRVDNLYKMQEKNLQSLPTVENDMPSRIKTNRKVKSK
jgi:hypothetical protein